GLARALDLQPVEPRRGRTARHAGRHAAGRPRAARRGVPHRARRRQRGIHQHPPAGRAAQEAKMLFSYIATCFACNLHSTIHWGSVPLNLTAYADAIRAASVEYGVDEAFLRAIIHAESAFNPRALSLKGAQGLMQLMPGTAGDMGVLDAFDTG